MDFAALLQYGIAGIVIAALIFGYLWTKPSVDKLLEDNARLVAQRDRLVDTYEQKVIPALAGFIDLTDELKPLLHDLLTELETARRDRTRDGDRRG